MISYDVTKRSEKIGIKQSMLLYELVTVVQNMKHEGYMTSAHTVNFYHFFDIITFTTIGNYVY